jgi:hypothetical protein
MSDVLGTYETDEGVYVERGVPNYRRLAYDLDGTEIFVSTVGSYEVTGGTYTIKPGYQGTVTSKQFSSIELGLMNSEKLAFGGLITPGPIVGAVEGTVESAHGSYPPQSAVPQLFGLHTFTIVFPQTEITSAMDSVVIPCIRQLSLIQRVQIP